MLGTYVVARIARLYPPFLFALAVSLLVYFAMEFFGLPGRAVAMRLPDDMYSARDIVHLSASDIKSALIMLQGMLEINGPLWSLYIEVKMYVLFACAVAFCSVNRSFIVSLVFALIFILAAKAGVDYNPSFSRYAAIWLIGALAYYVWNECANSYNRILMCLILIITAEVWNIVKDGTSPWTVAQDVLIVISLSWLMFKLRVRIFGFQRIADCSYSLYITHFPILLIGQSLLIHWGNVSVGAAIGVAIASTVASIYVALIGGTIEAKKTLIQNWALSAAHTFKFR
jgi:peptidoglycan/LPS O-acetylase OafA/YrhL